MKGEISILGERRVSRFDPNLAEKIRAWDRELTKKEEAEKRRMELEARLRHEGELRKKEEAARLRREREDRLKPKVAKPAEEAKVASGSRYALMNGGSTYALAMHTLRKACERDSNYVHPTFVKKDGSVVYRPLTFEENIRARLDDYYTLENPNGGKRTDDERLRLFRTCLDSCTGIACKKGSTLFKIITESEDLIAIPKNFCDSHIPANYSQLQGAELGSDKGKYNESLTKKQVLKHPAWNAAVTDQSLLKNYAELVFRMEDGKNMGFWVRQNTSEDELRALYVFNVSNGSYVIGYNDLDLDGNRFVRVTHRAPQAP